MKTKRAIIRLTPEALAQILGLRGEVRIVDATFDRNADTVELHLHGDGLPDSVHVNEGAAAPWISLESVAVDRKRAIIKAIAAREQIAESIAIIRKNRQ